VSYSYNAKDFEGKIRTDDASFFGKFGNLREQMPMGSNPRRKESERRDDEMSEMTSVLSSLLASQRRQHCDYGGGKFEFVKCDRRSYFERDVL
jgi:hypothetical protein